MFDVFNGVLYCLSLIWINKNDLKQIEHQLIYIYVRCMFSCGDHRLKKKSSGSEARYMLYMKGHLSKWNNPDILLNYVYSSLQLIGNVWVIYLYITGRQIYVPKPRAFMISVRLQKTNIYT